MQEQGKNKDCDLMKRMSLPKAMDLATQITFEDYQIIILQTR